MRALIRAFLVSLAVALAVCPVGAGRADDRIGEMDAVARAFLKAHQAKDLDALMGTADVPFFVGTFRNPKVLKTAADLRAELKSRLSGKFPARVVKTLTWDQAITTMLSPDEERRTRAQLKPAMDVTGEDGGYAALGDPVGGAKGKSTQVAVADKRLLVGIRAGKAKVVGILME
jgi:hypothetical protein